MSATSSCLKRSDFRRACAQFATGISVLTTSGADGSPHGLTVNSFTSVSAEPPLVLVCIDLRCTLLPHFETCGSFAINILSEDQRSISSRFADLVEGRFDEVDWRCGRSGAPLLNGCIGVLECRAERRILVGDHLVLIGEVIATDCQPGRPLLYFASAYGKVQH